MKNVLGVLLFAGLFFACKETVKDPVNESPATEQTESAAPEVTYVPFGDTITTDHADAIEKISRTYHNLTVGDSLNIKMTAKVNSVCQAKGCWMKLDLGNEEEVMVKFKDYAFFVPKNISGKDVIIEGVAFVDEMSVEDQKHYAEDAGKTEAEIAEITQPKRTYSFLADGVLLVEKQ
ncbi:branched-chain amino acid aminotransferase [Mangrovimonas yunxiaonensis]|uniref:Branched-chain amino acid aminotransferase n=1 Tax=Mangrovimonas yunxiaonensis TaxID=1197477 RepID=A0A084TIJ0_9FLAO|nr:DUF4920 domain-containing protein [Mangrovimonas yunxiaonensis]KFB00526.1 branched-chain amino acid aminotransferase [Mangrovimonas yunxiaonensis]GGH47352.1 hypothetical protein GCM10011364_22130 [Mangrovimonas yunxiaonensis]